jgi:hypothetical protein
MKTQGFCIGEHISYMITRFKSIINGRWNPMMPHIQARGIYSGHLH